MEKKKLSYGKHLQILMLQGPAICLSLTGKACEAASELSVENLNSDTGVVQLKIDELYQKDKDQLAYAAYDSFENFK